MHTVDERRTVTNVHNPYIRFMHYSSLFRILSVTWFVIRSVFFWSPDVVRVTVRCVLWDGQVAVTNTCIQWKRTLWGQRFPPHCLVQIWPLYYTATFHLTPTVTRDESVEPLDPPPDSKPGDRVYVDGYQHDVAGGWIRFRPAVMSVILYAWCLTTVELDTRNKGHLSTRAIPHS